jgi:hypothetical protein
VDAGIAGQRLADPAAEEAVAAQNEDTMHSTRLLRFENSRGYALKLSQRKIGLVLPIDRDLLKIRTAPSSAFAEILRYRFMPAPRTIAPHTEFFR